MSEALLGSELDGMVTRYLEELADALRRLPASRRDQLVSEIREHIAELRTELVVRDRSDMETLLNRVGLPEDIAAVALEGEEELVEDEPPPAAAPAKPGHLSKRVMVAGALAVVVLGFVLIRAASSNGHSVARIGIAQFAVPTPPKAPNPLNLVIVPDVVGESQAEAAAALSAAGLSVSIDTAPSSVGAGTVVAQDPAAGSSVRLVRGVEITVSSGPAAPAS